MRRYWWLWALGVTAAVIVGILAAMRPRSDELEFLKPYSTGEVTIYVQFSNTPGPLEFVRDQRMNFHNIPTQRLIGLIERHFSSAKGWKSDVLGSYTHFDPRTGAETGDWIAVLGDEDITTISLEHKLTSFEVWMIRMRNLGRDPFEKY